MKHFTHGPRIFIGELIVNYMPRRFLTENSPINKLAFCRVINREELYLIDSGAQFKVSNITHEASCFLDFPL